MAGLTDLHQSKRGLSAVVACLVQTLNESDPTFQTRFMARLEAAYYDLRDQQTGTPPGASKNDHEALEPLSWVREMLTGFDLVNGQGKPFLSHYDPKIG